MGCNVCKKVESLDLTNEQASKVDNMQNEKVDENPNECQYTQININSIYLMGNKASNIKGKVKPEDREQIALGVQTKLETERNTKREINKVQTSNPPPIQNKDQNLIKADNNKSLENQKKEESQKSNNDHEVHKQSSSNNIGVLLAPSSFVIETKEKLTKKYEIMGTIGRGAFGEVHKTRNKVNNEIYALKIIHKYLYPNIETLIQEIEILKTLDHPNILRIYEYYQDKKSFYIISEYYAGGELLNKILTLKQFEEKDAARIMRQLLSAVKYCHDRNVVHRDLKPDNLVLENDDINSNIKIIDFGTAKLFKMNEIMKDITGTAYYIAPEVLKENYTEKCDIWSCGVIMYILLSGKPPFSGNSTEEILKEVEGGKINFRDNTWNKISKDAISLMKQMLCYDPKTRISAKEALNHNWITSFVSSKVTSNELENTLQNLKGFRAFDNFQKAALTFMANRLTSQSDEKLLRDIFVSLDSNQDGTLSLEEMVKGFQNLGYTEEEANKEVKKILQYIDVNESGSIDYNEFLMANMSHDNLYSETKLHQAFDFFDQDKNGKISIKELIVIFKGILGESKTNKYFVNPVDINKDGEISFEEFKRLITKFIFDSKLVEEK